MRLVSVKLQNFRSYKVEVEVRFTNPSVIIGKNDAGKSSLLDALDHFFNDTKLEPEDCSVGTNSKVVCITCVFDQYPSSLVLDEQHETSFEAEHLLNAEGRLEIVQEHKVASGKGSRKVFVKCIHPTAEKACDLLSLTNAKLKARAREVDAELEGVNQSVNPPLREAIRSAVGELTPQEQLIELNDKQWENIERHLPVFAVFRVDRKSTDQDDEAQDPMKAAVKQAIKEQESALSEVTEAVKREVKAIAERTVEKLKEMAPDLANALTPHVENKSWASLFSVTLTGDGDIPINKRGSGTRRLVLLNFFRAEAERAAEGKDASVIYAVEEPETSQHPINQVMLTQAFQELAARPGCQVILTTHTPNLARRFLADQLLLVKKGDPAPSIVRGSDENCLTEIVKSLGVHVDHDIKVFVGVEGPNDMDFWRNLSKALRADGVDVFELADAEARGVLMFVPLGGSNMAVWTSRLAGLNKPEVYIMDRDTQPPQDPKYKQFSEDVQARGAFAYTTTKLEVENYIHHSLIIPDHPNYAGAGADFEDVPNLLARVTHEDAEGPGTWAGLSKETQKSKESRAKKRLNGIYAGKMTQALLRQSDPNNELIGVLNKIKDALTA